MHSSWRGRRPRAAVGAGSQRVLDLQRSAGNVAVAALLAPSARLPVVQRKTLADLPAPTGQFPDNDLNRLAFVRHATSEKVCLRNTKTVPECLEEFNNSLGYELKVDTWTARSDAFNAIVASTATFTVTAAKAAWADLDRAIENSLIALTNQEGGAKDPASMMKFRLRNLNEFRGLVTAWASVHNADSIGFWEFKKKPFGNHPQRLPKLASGSYTEFRVPPPNKDVHHNSVNHNPGPLRGLFADAGNGKYFLYYTEEHYNKNSFWRINSGANVKGAFEA